MRSACVCRTFEASTSRPDSAVVAARGAGASAALRALTLVVATIGSIAAGAAPGAATTKTGTAGPTEDGPVCAVLPTADGFAALRERPAVSAKLIARMKTEANVIVQERPKHHIVRQGGWIQVRYWPDGELPGPGEPGYDKAVTGWVAQRLIGECG